DPRGSRTGFGSLLLGVHDEEGRLGYAGNVGTGFDEKGLRSLLAKLESLETPGDPFHDRPRSVRGHWVRPKLVAEVAFTEWTSDGRIRHPVFHGLRTDKDPRAITREAAIHEAPGEAKPARRKARTPAKPLATKAAAGKPARTPAKRAAAKAPPEEIEGIAISHGDRVVDPGSKATKLDLVRYYHAIAPHMLPHLVGRPIALVR